MLSKTFKKTLCIKKILYMHFFSVDTTIFQKNQFCSKVAHNTVKDTPQVSDLKGKVIYTKYSKHSNETNTFMGLGRAGRFGQS